MCLGVRVQRGTNDIGTRQKSREEAQELSLGWYTQGPKLCGIDTQCV